MCNMAVNEGWDESHHEDMAPMHKWIGENNAHVDGFKALIFSGDNDAICSTLGTFSWIDPTFDGLVSKELFNW